MTGYLAVEGAVTDRWPSAPFGRLAAQVETPKGKQPLPLLSLSSEGVVAERPADAKQQPAADYAERYWTVRPGELVVNPMWLIGGGIGVTWITGAVSPDYRVYRLSEDLEPQYVHHLLRATPYREQYRLLVRAETTFDRRITKQDFCGLPIPVPSRAEQQAIAGYLDRETARIDALIAAKRHVLRRLAEREPAYVEESVRRGSWPAVALRRVIARIEQGWSPQCDARLPEGEEWGVLKVGCVNGGWFKPDEIKALPEDLKPRTEYTVRDGDLLMSRANTKDLVGGAALASSVRPRTLLSDKLYRIKLDEKRVDPRFVCLWLQTRAVRSTFELEATGASDSMQNIGQDTVRRVVVPVPPKAVQAQIVADCEWQQRRARSISLLVRQQIGLLAERRQALITAAVTGRTKVPVAA